MTALQKENITKMRGKGMGYTRIAVSLGISENTVKSFCRRNKLGGDLSAAVLPNTEPQYFCKQCGKEIKQASGRKIKKFCSYQCRMDWWKSHPENISRKAVYIFSCLYCKNDFTAYGNKNRKFCSHACYVAFRFNSAGNVGGGNE